jgi:hypothetical protein
VKRGTACELTENSLFLSEQRRNRASFRLLRCSQPKLGSVASQPVAFATGCQAISLFRGALTVMSDPKFVRAARLNRVGDFVEDITSVDLRDLPPFTTLLVWTTNSLYRMVITRWPEVYVQGGDLFSNPTAAYVDGATSGESGLRVGWIGVGLLVEIRSGGWRITTSPVRAITTEQAAGWVVH